MSKTLSGVMGLSRIRPVSTRRRAEAEEKPRIWPKAQQSYVEVKPQVLTKKSAKCLLEVGLCPTGASNPVSPNLLSARGGCTLGIIISIYFNRFLINTRDNFLPILAYLPILLQRRTSMELVSAILPAPLQKINCLFPCF